MSYSTNNNVPGRGNFPEQYQPSYKYMPQSYSNSGYSHTNPSNMSNMSNMGNSNIPNMSGIPNIPNISSMSNIYQANQTSIALFHIPSDATNSLYIDGIPNDASEREVSHIFRPFPGFQCIRLIKKTTNTGRDYFLCFVDFENVLQSTVAQSTLQGYRFDKHDRVGLKISYAKQSKEVTKQKSSKKYK